jgi:hypothetical protein
MIHFHCTQCGAELKALDHLCDMTTKCFGCGHRLRPPSQSPKIQSSAPAAMKLLVAGLILIILIIGGGLLALACAN